MKGLVSLDLGGDNLEPTGRKMVPRMAPRCAQLCVKVGAPRPLPPGMPTFLRDAVVEASRALHSPGGPGTQRALWGKFLPFNSGRPSCPAPVMEETRDGLRARPIHQGPRG